MNQNSRAFLVTYRPLLATSTGRRARIKEEFENGRDYYKLHGTEVRLPRNIEHHPLADAIAWHNAERFLG